MIITRNRIVKSVKYCALCQDCEFEFLDEHDPNPSHAHASAAHRHAEQTAHTVFVRLETIEELQMVPIDAEPSPDTCTKNKKGAVK